MLRGVGTFSDICWRMMAIGDLPWKGTRPVSSL